MRGLHIVTAALMFGLTSMSAYACIINNPPGWRIARAGAKTVVLVKVLDASYTGPRKPHKQRKLYNGPWKGSVQLKRVLRGATKTKRFSIERSGDSAACDDGIPPPTVGQTWVLYLGPRDGVQAVLLSYPLNVARSADPTLFSRKVGS